MQQECLRGFRQYSQVSCTGAACLLLYPDARPSSWKLLDTQRDLGSWPRTLGTRCLRTARRKGCGQGSPHTCRPMPTVLYAAASHTPQPNILDSSAAYAAAQGNQSNACCVTWQTQSYLHSPHPLGGVVEIPKP